MVATGKTYQALSEREEKEGIEKYCICRRDHDGHTLMIMCDYCQEWFHIECLALKQSQLKVIEKK